MYTLKSNGSTTARPTSAVVSDEMDDDETSPNPNRLSAARLPQMLHTVSKCRERNTLENHRTGERNPSVQFDYPRVMATARL